MKKLSTLLHFTPPFFEFC